MPSIQEHVAKAKHNEQFLEQLPKISTQFPDWLVVGAFYTALHYVDACLALRSLHPPTHHLRSGYVARIRDLRTIYPEYRTLEDTSRDARYTHNPMTDQHVMSSLEISRKIKQHILPLLPANAI